MKTKIKYIGTGTFRVRGLPVTFHSQQVEELEESLISQFGLLRKVDMAGKLVFVLMKVEAPASSLPKLETVRANNREERQKKLDIESKKLADKMQEGSRKKTASSKASLEARPEKTADEDEKKQNDPLVKKEKRKSLKDRAPSA